MLCKKQITFTVAATMLISMPVSASVGADMQTWFDSAGGLSNATPPSSYKGQTMNGYSGGSFYARSPVKTYQLGSYTPPSLNIGCGGIDAHAGSFSFINQAGITALLQNVGTSLSYAFLLAIKSSMPEMSSLMEYLNDQAAKINGANINSCEAAQGIMVATGLDKTQRSKDAQSHVLGTLTNLKPDSFDSWNSAKKDAAAARAAENAAIAADPSREDALKPGNVVWKALSKTTGLSKNDKEFIMSLTGTIVIGESTGSGENSKQGEWKYIAPTITSIENFIGYSDSPTVSQKIFYCPVADQIDCLNPTDDTATIETFMTKVSTKMDNLLGGVTSRQPQSLTDLKFIDATSIPVWKMIATTASISPEFVTNYKRYIATDIAYEYVGDALNTAENIMFSANNQAPSPSSQEAIGKIRENLKNTKETLHAQRIVEAQKLQKQVELERQLQFLQQALIAGVPSQAFTSMQVFN